jgi:hypothetical protein
VTVKARPCGSAAAIPQRGARRRRPESRWPELRPCCRRSSGRTCRFRRVAGLGADVNGCVPKRSNVMPCRPPGFLIPNVDGLIRARLNATTPSLQGPDEPTNSTRILERRSAAGQAARANKLVESRTSAHHDKAIHLQSRERARSRASPRPWVSTGDGVPLALQQFDLAIQQPMIVSTVEQRCPAALFDFTFDGVRPPAVSIVKTRFSTCASLAMRSDRRT